MNRLLIFNALKVPAVGSLRTESWEQKVRARKHSCEELKF